MSSLTIMQAAVSSVNCGLKLNPSFEKNSMDFLRFFTGRFTKICLVATFLANLKSIHQRMSDGKIASLACCRLEYIGCNYYSARLRALKVTRMDQLIARDLPIRPLTHLVRR